MDKKQKILEDENITRLLIKLSVPAVIGMATMALYNFVDRIYVGIFINDDAIGALQLSMPIQMVILAVGLMIGIGTASIISRCLGAKCIERAEKTLGNSFSLVLIFSIFLMLIGKLFVKDLLIFIGAEGLQLQYAMEYLDVILYLCVVFVFAMNANNLLRAEGNAKLAMYLMIASSLINIGLDPIFIEVLNLGVKGAAIATVIAQTVTSVYVFFHFFRKKSLIHFHLKHLKINFKRVRETIAIGSSAFARQISLSVMNFIMNSSLLYYGAKAYSGGGKDYVNIAGVVGVVIMMFMMPLFGIVQGALPIIGYNYGAKKYHKVRETLKKSVIIATLIALFGFVIIMLFPATLFKAFDMSESLVEQGVRIIRIVIFLVPLIGFQVIGAGFFQAIGKALPAFFLSLARQVIFFIPLMIILPIYMGVDGIFYTFPVADILATLITAILVFSEMKKLKNKQTLEAI